MTLRSDAAHARAAGVALLLLCLGVAACAPRQPPGRYPSLAPRPGEAPRQIADTPAAAQPAPAGLAGQIAASRRALAETGRRLAALEAALARSMAAARQTPPGAEPWIEAQVALSRLVDARGLLAEVSLGAAPLALAVEPLAPDAPERAALARLEEERAAVARRVAQRVEGASRTLGLPGGRPGGRRGR